MNTPEPCDTCYLCGYNPLRKNDPTDAAECRAGYKMGDPECPQYRNWKDQSPYPPKKVPRSGGTIKPPYPKKIDHPFTVCYGLDVLSQEIHDRFLKLENKNNLSEFEFLESILVTLRRIRDTKPQPSEIRSYYNQVCDRLDVLSSKILQESKESSPVPVPNDGTYRYKPNNET